MTERAFPPPLAHGPIEEVFPDLFLVRGGFRLGPGMTITRNMAIVRQGSELVLLNTVRLSPEGEAALDKLGKVAAILRIGAFHGLDDPYYVHRYGPLLWAPPGTKHQGDGITAKDLTPTASPLEGARVFVFEKGRRPEVAIVLARDGGILLTCDSYQHWTTYDGCSPLAKIVMRVMGFGPTVVGGPWVKAMGPAIREDLTRLLDEPFAHLVPAHGTVLREVAKAGLRTAIARRFGA
jgi:hypothetical protein